MHSRRRKKARHWSKAKSKRIKGYYNSRGGVRL